MRARPLVAALAVASAVTIVSGQGDEADGERGLGAPATYTELRESEPVAVGHITGERVTVDRFTFWLDDGDLYLVPEVTGQPPIAVFLGEGRITGYPPDAVELQQLRKVIDEDYVDETFDRFVFWMTDDLGNRLAALADDTLGRDADEAADVLRERREKLLEDQLANPDSRVLSDLWWSTLDAISDPPDRTYLYAEIDGDEHDWFSIEIEPLEREEIRIGRYQPRHDLTDVWMTTHALEETGPVDVTDGFPRDPETDGPVAGDRDGDDESWHARDYGLPHRVLTPTHERWAPRLSVSRTDVDIAIEGNGDATASAALVIEAREPLASLRLRVSPFIHVTDVRWRRDVTPNVDRVDEVRLLLPTDDDAPDTPAPIDGDQLHFVQETHDRRFEDNLHEPWLTVLLPSPVDTGERFILEVAYEGEPVERLRGGRGYVLKDPLYWMPQHPHNRQRRFDLTFRIPDELRVASGGTMQDEHVIDGTRITRWTVPEPVRGFMAFHLGRFDISEVTGEDSPPLAIYADRNHLGFSPGNKDKTIEDLAGSLATYVDYYGPFPFESLLVTETQESGGQAFPGLVLLTFQAFGHLHSGESELFWSHEVAHQWWGASIDWEDYRDQWMPEGFAHYSAALYALMGLEDEGQYLRMLDAWRHDVLGEVNVGQGLGIKRYGFRPEIIRESDGHESGPLVAGYRLRTVETPYDYRLLIYEKGAFVLHMLRMLMIDPETGSDERFKTMMRAFVADHNGQVANTAGFEAAVTDAFGEPMDWFFDQWVYGTDVPTYRPDLETTRLRDSASPYLLHGQVRQEDVPDDFRMPVPIRVEFEEHPPMVYRVMVDQPEVTVEIPLPAEPSDVDFNYHYAVLAHVR